jgi:hydrogenase-1 operon protein HyaE
MNQTLASDAHPLLAQLFLRHGFERLDEASHDAFVARRGHALLLFTEDPARFREVLDLAVIAPQLALAFPGRFRTGVLLPAAARAIAPRYRFRRWPAFVLLRDGLHVGAIDGMRNWDEYLRELGRLLEAEPCDPPGLAPPPAARH